MKIFELLFSVNSSQLDKPAKQLDKIGDEAKEAKREVGGLGSALDKFSGLDGPIGDIATQIKGVRENANTALSGVQSLTGGLTGVVASVGVVTGAVVGLAGAAGILAAFNFAGPLDDIGDLANKLGLSADQASILSDRLSAAGTSIDTYFSSIDKVNKALTKADEEGSKASEALAKLNINVKDGANPIETLNTITGEYGKKLKEGKVSAEEVAALQLVLGKNYREVIVAATEVKGAQEEVNRLYELGIGISEQGAEAAGEFEKAQLGLSHIFKVVGSQLVRDILPTFTALINQFRESYEQGGLVKVIFSGIALAADLLMVPIKVLTNGFIVLETTIMSIGKGLAGVFAAIATRSLDPLKEANAEVEKLWQNASKRVSEIDLFGQRNNNDTIQAPRQLEVTPTGSSAPNKVKDKKDKSGPQGLDNGSYQDGRIAREGAEVGMQQTKVLFMYSEEARKAEEANQKLLTSFINLGNPLNSLIVQQQQIEDLMKRYPERADELYNAWLKVQEQVDKTVGATTEGTKGSFDIMQRVGMTAFQGLEDALVSLATQGKFSFRSFAQSIIADLIRMTTQLYIIKPLMAAMGFPVPAANGAVMSNGSMTGFAKGGAFSGGAVTAFASGGVVNSPTLFPMRNGTGLMGEAGPEGILPLKRNSQGKLGVIAQGAGGGGIQNNSYAITVNVQGGNSDEETGQVVSREIRKQVEDISRKTYMDMDKRRRITVGATA